MTDVSDTPTAPPAGPVIPLGITSQVMLGTTGLAGAVGVIFGFLDGDHSTETTFAFVSAVITLITWAIGRFAQATAIYRDAPSPLQGVTNVLGYAQDSLGEFTATGDPDEPTDDYDDEELEDTPESDVGPNTPFGLGGGQQ